MRTSTKRFLSIIFATALTAAAIFIYALLIVPTIDDIQAMSADKKAKDELYITQDNAVKKISEVLSRAETPPLQEKFNLALPAEDPLIASIVSQLNGIAILNSVSINNIATQIGPIQSPPKDVLFVSGIGTVKVSFEIAGNYESIKKFLENVETNVRLIDVTQLDISGDSTGSDVLKARVTVDAYYQSRTQQAQSGSESASSQLQKK